MLKEVDHFRYLGVCITNTFDWARHINLKCSEALKSLGLLRRTIATAPEKVKLQAYKTLCRPRLEYAAEVWDPFLVGHVEKIGACTEQGGTFHR